jgi:hypothetical protein
VSTERAPTREERLTLASQHVKIPQFRSVQSYLRDSYRSAGRTKRLAGVTAAVAIAAVAAGATASPALASTRDLASTSPIAAVAAASHHPGSAALDTSSTQVPFGRAAGPLAQPAVAGPAAPLGQPATATPHVLPSQSKEPVASVSVSTPTKSGQAPAAQPAAPAPAPPPQPYLIYDSVTPTQIPQGQVTATYATGGYAVPASVVAGRQVIWIDTLGTDPAASALDVEPGDATPAVAASWAFHKLSADPNGDARIYTMISEWPAVKAAIATLPPAMQAHVHYWIADPTGVAHVVPGSSATQWYWGKSYDISTAIPGF